MKFPYQLFRGSYYPIIPIAVINTERKVNTSVLVDSGAAISIFNSAVGRFVGIDIESGEKRVFQGASAKLTGYIHNIEFVVAGKKINCRAAFSDDLSTSFNLLGREGVFDKFLITFNEKEREIIMDDV